MGWFCCSFTLVHTGREKIFSQVQGNVRTIFSQIQGKAGEKYFLKFRGNVGEFQLYYFSGRSQNVAFHGKVGEFDVLSNMKYILMAMAILWK